MLKPHNRDGFWNQTIVGKVPQVTISFWIIKLLTTGMGETTSDFLARQFDPPLIVATMGALVAAALIVQLNAARLRPWLYWLVVILVSIFGTMVADVIHVAAGVPYFVSTMAFALAVLAIFVAWYRREGTLDITSIDNRRRELFYWALVVVTFALGTAIGDLVASSFRLGFLASALLFSGAIIVPGALYWRSGGTAVAPFWCAYVLTRPVGASFADWMGVGPERGGLGWGTGPVSLALGGVIVVVALAVWLTRRRASSSVTFDIGQ
ncbi:hypothetical protein [Devosia sp.]|uniref:COG4705 family protein n=1 Tax=Devosia sp. TaxID=1871048 RepID=UPI00326536D7